MTAAFASMSFLPSDTPATSVELTQGTAGGENWTLSASRAKGGLSIELTGESTGSGLGITGAASAFSEIQASATVFGSGLQAERVIFGVVPEGVVQVQASEASTADGSIVSADVLDVPDEIDPNLNAFVERFNRSIQEECLDRVIPLGEAHLRKLVREYVAHYHEERPHQGLDGEFVAASTQRRNRGPIARRERLGGLLNQYYREAA